MTSVRVEVQPHSPPSLRATEIPMTTRLRAPAPIRSNRRAATGGLGGRTTMAKASAPATRRPANQKAACTPKTSATMPVSG